MNEITINLSAEDRARLDRLTAALEQRHAQVDEIRANGGHLYVENTQAETPAEPQEIEQEAPKAEPQEIAQPTTESDTVAEPEPAEQAAPWTEPEPVKAEPSVTLEQIQQKVVQLAAGNGGAKKAQVREIISAYGTKVSDLKEQPDKWDEVWDKLTALEG